MTDELETATPEGHLTVCGFRLRPTGLEPVGEPTFEQWDGLGEFLRYLHTGTQFWIGDWMNYGEGAFAERYSQCIQKTGYELHTLQTYAWISRQVPKENRTPEVPFGHYANGIAALEPREQKKWIKKVVKENLTQAELKTELRLARRRKVRAETPIPAGTFRVIYADNPWQYDDSGEIVGSAYGKAERHYPTMSIEELIAFYSMLNSMGRFFDDAVMFQWVPAPLLLQKPGPREVIEAAGFTPKTGIVWDKVEHNFGHYVSVRHEHLIICTRGSCTPDAPNPQPDSVVTVSTRTDGGKRIHSKKPEIFRQIITKLYTSGPYLELFGRDPVDGWSVYGNDPNVPVVA